MQKLFRHAKNRAKLENYRPISLLSSLNKVFEKSLHQRIINFCDRNQLFTSAQFGGRYKKSCADAITTVTDYLRDETKLYEPGFRGEVTYLMRSYLGDRVHYVSTTVETTSCQNIETGVPRDSILWSLLFLLYINNIMKCDINCKIALLANDTSVLITSQKNYTGIQQDV